LSTHQPSKKIGSTFIQLLTADSTNNYALELLKQNLADSGTAIFAQEQTNGRGQMGKKWEALQGENIILTIIVDISTVHIQNQFNLLAMAALGCYDFFNKYAGNETAIKWSNDIYWKDKKAGGILIETINHNNKRFAIVGMGININQTVFNENIINAVSLKQITGNNFNVIELAKELCNCIDTWYNILLSQNNHQLSINYNSHLYKKNKAVTLKKGAIKFNCIIKSVNAYGELQVENGLCDSFRFGEIEWMI
jgi:BirA family biotin operon repressor/biotin-[acetyl-CoA-carboxylase] ligase